MIESRTSLSAVWVDSFVNPRATERDREAFLRALDGVIYGDDPKEGFVRGRTFLHPNLGFAFTAPEGFALENTPQAVLGATTAVPSEITTASTSTCCARHLTVVVLRQMYSSRRKTSPA